MKSQNNNALTLFPRCVEGRELAATVTVSLDVIKASMLSRQTHSKAIIEPFPKEFVIEAWKASVGYSLERWRTHEAYMNSPLALGSASLVAEE